MSLLKKFVAAVGIGAASAGASAASVLPQEQWQHYKRYQTDNYSIMLVDNSILSHARLAEFHCYWIEYAFSRGQLSAKAGYMMPKPEMADIYYGLEDAISLSLENFGGRVAASQSGFGKRKVWFCAPNEGIEDAVRMQAEEFDRIPLEWGKASTADLLKLKPTNLEQQLAGNEDILKAIAENGDDGSKPRPVMHWIVEFEANASESLSNTLSSLGYRIEEVSNESIRFSRVSTLSIESTAEETENLIAFCDQVGCHYDGWETPIQK